MTYVVLISDQRLIVSDDDGADLQGSLTAELPNPSAGLATMAGCYDFRHGVWWDAAAVSSSSADFAF